MSFDAIVIGAGHNGLVVANYLAKAKLKVLVVERRSTLGGCCTTEELIPNAPGFKVNGGAIDHILIQRTPIIQELELDSFGLKYVSIEPMFEVPFEDGSVLRFYKDLKKTIQEISRFSKRDAERYSKLVEEWSHEEALLERLMLNPPPKISELLGIGGLKAIFKPSMLSTLPEAARVDFNSMVRTVVMSANQLLNEEFEDDHTKVALSSIFSLIFSTMPPSLPSSGLMAIMHTMLYKTGLKRPIGGSGALIDALVSSLRAKGGEVLSQAEVRRIITDKGEVKGVELADGRRLYSKIVVSSVDAQRTLLKLLDPGTLDESLARKLKSLRITSYGMTYHAALHALPKAAKHELREEPGKLLALNSLEQIEKAYHIANSQRALSPTPLLAVNFPTSYDATLAPLGKHTLYCWAQFVPDNSPMIWEKEHKRFSEDAQNKIEKRLEEFWPDLGELIIAKKVETPGDLAERLWIQRGNTQHIDPTLEQMYYYRPLPELSHYKTPIRGLYLTGAGTHPGGGISGMPGYNTAITILKELNA
ncbi:hypothetical protein B9Q11_01385 [Candidatus Marsarchaeota G2 archaeon ECH_B_SAG-F08]|jgi:Phytoene dehydrogenase and related proteins|uniref:Pyridine nucleotide-disulfide oxidoreductase domain-containing protein 2 n=5 Tax=Candidatus Marsarchaeota TaxID=1978152 RepID=A0A2R6BK90_9ARCH|nr:MAG: hypothetical protein B9Q01_04625 [Candidatus Marsarchaeota G1 archaeon OSP_D]PSN96064.1 MAG: hypothetical protein B9P99_00605 [Candidatus Marsarchaeota G1 archaeon OSP_B]PSN99077.1 MAG: hypothetical protein B9Q11_01385 [Candidatus Marsarchaeota G2 archaeon ECH_B_SAG-F08]